MRNFQGNRNSGVGFIFVIIITLIIFGLSTSASADQERCIQAIDDYGDRLQSAMLQNRKCVKEIQAKLKLIMRSAKKYELDEDNIEGWIKDNSINPKEAAKIQKMKNKSDLIKQGYDQIIQKINSCKPLIFGTFERHLTEAKQACGAI